MRRALLLTLLLVGCVHVNKSVLMDRSAYPLPMMDVSVFLPGDWIPDSCERVAILHASGDYTNESQMLDKLREEAGKLGANAVHFQRISDGDADAFALWCPEGVKGTDR